MELKNVTYLNCLNFEARATEHASGKEEISATLSIEEKDSYVSASFNSYRESFVVYLNDYANRASLTVFIPHKLASALVESLTQAIDRRNEEVDAPSI